MKTRLKFILEVFTDGSDQFHWEFGSAEDIVDLDAVKIHDIGVRMRHLAINGDQYIEGLTPKKHRP